jgi:hypothetical protein
MLSSFGLVASDGEMRRARGSIAISLKRMNSELMEAACHEEESGK